VRYNEQYLLSCIRDIQHFNYYKICILVQLIELLQFLIVRSHGESLMEEEICIVDSCTTNSILREIKYFQTLTRRSENVLTIARRDATIVRSGRATIITPHRVQAAAA
jgi:hypothetical protein